MYKYHLQLLIELEKSNSSKGQRSPQPGTIKIGEIKKKKKISIFCLILRLSSFLLYIQTYMPVLLPKWHQFMGVYNGRIKAVQELINIFPDSLLKCKCKYIHIPKFLGFKEVWTNPKTSVVCKEQKDWKKEMKLIVQVARKKNYHHNFKSKSHLI